MLDFVKRRRFITAALVGLAALSLVAAACGAGSGAAVGTEAGATVLATDRFVSLDDLLGAGFKKSKTFDVEGLQGAVEAYYGFWGADPYARNEFEARFYPSHAEAVSLGVGPAEERTGRDAVLKADEASWDEGLKEARACTRSAGNDSSNCRISKYGGYVVYGNLVLVCQGRDASTARENCDGLLASLP